MNESEIVSGYENSNRFNLWRLVCRRCFREIFLWLGLASLVTGTLIWQLQDGLSLLKWMLYAVGGIFIVSRHVLARHLTPYTIYTINPEDSDLRKDTSWLMIVSYETLLLGRYSRWILAVVSVLSLMSLALTVPVLPLFICILIAINWGVYVPLLARCFVLIKFMKYRFEIIRGEWISLK